MICVLVKYNCVQKHFLISWGVGWGGTHYKIIFCFLHVYVSLCLIGKIMFSTQIFKKDLHQLRKQILGELLFRRIGFNFRYIFFFYFEFSTGNFPLEKYFLLLLQALKHHFLNGLCAPNELAKRTCPNLLTN